jgi:hypothetical protein
MNDHTRSRSPVYWAVLLALLLSAQASPGQAAPRATGFAAAGSAAASVAPCWVAQTQTGDWRALFSDRDTMIQVGVVVGAIAIFLLTRSTK